MYRMVTVVGGNRASSADMVFAERLGAMLAGEDFAVVCGGGQGVMEAVSKGCFNAGGIAIAILPGEDISAANPYISVAVPTGIGVARNRIVALAGEVVCAVGGAYGTLSEIAFALQAGKPVCCTGSWSGIPGVTVVATPDEALSFVLKMTGDTDAQC